MPVFREEVNKELIYSKYQGCGSRAQDLYVAAHFIKRCQERIKETDREDKMNGIRNRKNVLSLLLIAVFLLLIPLSPYCYGDDSGKQVSSLLSSQQLKKWIDNGYRDERGLKVVILDTSFGPAARADYNAGHVPGCLLCGLCKGIDKNTF